ncbi:RNA polymerase sigma-70 factor, ECF subfamily [Amycolatopsis xylanica]|uniref:RNA polymerase sigma-70 factor, ECF subfamily n=1 Tax=Amycolatopsis xylanica TaxID=589385 RepID=A0A1H3AVG3_9PSEU|nr:sigma-70 family RNA polymerase sigma factor [Amycolatopsis xylanica]SDX33104.1 RNA polymerase sigma-70 factor, ECF subfamily [Amycolatopsis xylanica]
MSIEPDLLTAARGGDSLAFDQLVAQFRGELTAHCYRMLGSPHDAEDAVQESLLNAWRGLSGFEGRSSLRTWLYRICTNACLRLNTKRVLSPDHGPARHETDDLGEPLPGPWLEPWEDDPSASYLRRESVELAFVAALQHLPSTQRAVLILRQVLEYSAAETAEILDLTPAAVNSALQRARKAVEERVPARSQQAELSALGPDGQRELIDAFVAAWEKADVNAIVNLLAEDVRFTMPPLPAWFDGRENVTRFLVERIFANSWRLVPVRANGQLAIAGYMRRPDGVFGLGGINVLSLRDGLITEISSFLSPEVLTRFDLPEIFSD